MYNKINDDENTIRNNELFASAYVFDPSLVEDLRFLRVSVSQLKPVQRSKIRDMLLYDAQMQLVTSTTLPWGGAKFAKLTMLSGVEFHFEIVKANSDPNPDNLDGRLIKIIEPRGIEQNITYKTWTQQQIDESPTRLWQINQAVDSFNRALTFTYSGQQIGGRWCVSGIVLPDSTTVSYNYLGNFLQSVVHADGTTTTINYTYEPNAPNDIVVMDIFDPVAEPGHRNKKIYLSGTVQLVNGIFVPVSVDHVRGVKNGANEFTYLNFLTNVDGVDLVHVYEGGGKMKRIINWQNQVAYLADGWTVNGSYDVNGTTENEYQENTIDFYRTTAFRDDTGIETEYLYDAEGRRSYVLYGDGTFEAFCFGQNMNVTRYRDREGHVERSTYDANGNLLVHQFGLQDHPSNVGPPFDPVTGDPICRRFNGGNNLRYLRCVCWPTDQDN